MRKKIGVILLLIFLMTPCVHAEDASFSKTVEIEPALELGPEEAYDSAPIDVSSFRYAMILVEKSPPEKLLDPNVQSTEEEIYFTLNNFFYLDSNIIRENKGRSKYPLLVSKGFDGGGQNIIEVNTAMNAFKSRALRQVEVRAPYLVVRVQQKGASKTKLRIAVFLRK
ncbi:MAG: hypothetical protein EXS63_03585 [Candidatus Omnitrophica bacterium]|nr:hypothetical protein [Candidatus Omnitrophota bacterium]